MAQRRRGDLVFWFGPDGRTRHVAIYLGADRVVEASSTKGRTQVTAFRGTYAGHRLDPQVMRPFTTRTR